MNKINIPELVGYNKLEASTGRKIISPHVRIILNFFPQDKDPVFSDRSTKVRTISFEKGKTEATLIDFSWNKNIGTASGQWNAMIKKGRESSIDPKSGDIIDGDWIECIVIRNGIGYPLFRGIVDTIREGKTSVNGVTVSAWTIQGRDHGALCEVPIAWASLYVQSLGQLVKGFYTETVRGEVGGRPDELFKILIAAAFQKGEDGSKSKSTWALPSSLDSKIGKEIFYDALSIETYELRGSYRNELQLWTQAGQTLWDTFGTWCNPLLNELWLDFANINTENGMEAVIRERPFINTIDEEVSPWFNLKQWKVPNWLIDTYDIGRGGLERFNLFEITANFPLENMQEQIALTSPLINQRSINRHGIRPYQQSTKYVSPENEDQGAWSMESTEWMRLLVDWYGPNPYWLNGTITTGTVFPEIKIGNIFILDTGNKETIETFYVEGVSLNWRYDERGIRSQSQFTLTRGYRGSDRDAVKMVKKISEEFEGLF